MSLPGPSAARGQTLPVTIGEEYAAAAAALKAQGIEFQDTAAGSGRQIVYSSAGESVTLDFAMWPKDADAPASAWQRPGNEGKHLVLTHILDVAPGSDARRAWVRSFARDGRRWAYLSPQADAARPSADRAKYRIAAYLQWTSPPATFLFEAARAVGSAPGDEMTALDVTLDNPHSPRHF